MPYTTTLIIGAGQAGLAMSQRLTERSIDHVLLERGTIGNSWKTERWDSLRLLTPNWQTRLPGWTYDGDDPDGYMTMAQVAGYIDGYAASFSAPVQEETTVLSVKQVGGGYPGYEVQTDQGLWYARTVVIATGAFSTPVKPASAANLPDEITQLSPLQYRNPDILPAGGVLVVGASASGAQLADELVRAGRDVTLAVGRHIRLPRTYRGMDVQWWLDEVGALSQRYDEVADIEQARHSPSLQIVGSPEHHSIDLASLASRGVRLTGRLVDIDGTKVEFLDDLEQTTADADAGLVRLLNRFDAHATANALDTELDAATRPLPIEAPASPRRIGLVSEDINTVIWATGLRPSYPWLKARVLDETGHIRHDGGVVTEAPGLYVMGLPFMRRRKSSFIDGVGDDARDLAAHLVGYLDRTPLVV